MSVIRVRVSPLQYLIHVNVGKRGVRHEGNIVTDEPKNIPRKPIKVAIRPTQQIPVKIINSIDGILRTNDYGLLQGLPSLNGVKIIGDKTQYDYGIESPEALTNLEIEELLNNFFI